MDPRPVDEAPPPKGELAPRPSLKSYTMPKLSQHGKLPALTLSSSLVDE